MASPGPMYNWNPDQIQKKNPSYSFGTAERPGASEAPLKPPRPHTTPPVITPPETAGPVRSGSPSPKTSGPAFSFGPPESSTSRQASKDANLQGKNSSPGPQYNPNEKWVRKSVPGTVFAHPDPMMATLAGRGSAKQFISKDLAATGLASPGPANYEMTKLAVGPAYTMGKKEKVLMKRICPAPERARFFSKELARENIGAYSPGPKYSIPPLMGNASSIKVSFGKSDRHFEDLAIELKDKLGSIEKPYTAPSEARYMGAGQNACMLGKFSPGPKYHPDMNAVLSHAPQHSMGGKWKEPHSAQSPTKADYDEARRRALRQPLKDATAKVAPAYRFGGSRRGLMKGEENKSKAIQGKDSPGPVYRPNFESVEPHRQAVAIGGLH